MQFLYMQDLNIDPFPADQLRTFLKTLDKPRDYYAFAEEIIAGVRDYQNEIDEAIQARVKNWTFKRIARVDLAILRMAVFELLYRSDIPPVVTIDEAIEIGKEYSNEESRRFLNGILDKIKVTLDRPERTPA